MKSFIVEFWSRIFGLLSWISLFRFARLIVPGVKEPGAVELWVLANLVASIVFLTVPDAPNWRWWELLIVGYCSLRIVEVVIYQINVLLFDAYRKRKAGERYQLRGFRRLVLLLLHNYVELIFWFAVIYRHMSESFTPVANSLSHALTVSFSTMSGFGEATAKAADSAVEVVLQVQAVIGFLMALLVLARFISIIPQPETADEIEKTE